MKNNAHNLFIKECPYPLYLFVAGDSVFTDLEYGAFGKGDFDFRDLQ